MYLNMFIIVVNKLNCGFYLFIYIKIDKGTYTNRWGKKAIRLIVSRNKEKDDI